MRTPSLLAVFVLARVLILIGREVPLSPWSPVAFLWQDLLVVLIFATSERLVRRAWFSGTLYAAIVLYIALNLPLTRLLSSPLTVPMLRATRGTLVDSIQHHLTWENLGLMAIVILAGVTLPFLLRRVEPRPGVTVGLTTFAVALVAFGPFATSQVETGGLHRNVFGVLLATAMPRVATTQMVANWRRSPLAAADPPYELPAKEELARFKGAAAGRNVVLILLESTGAQYLKPYGAAEDPMPNLTALAEQAILFENAYAVYPESIKGLFSVLCSRYPAIDTRPEDYLHATTPSIAARLAEAGYGTALLHSGRFLYLGMEAIIRNRGFQVLQDAGDIGGNRNSSFGVDDKATVERMLGWIDSLPQSGCFFI